MRIIDIRIFGALVLGPRADFEKDRVAAGFVHEVVAVGHIGFEPCGGAGLERRQVDAELVETCRVAKPLARAAGDHPPDLALAS